MNFNLTQMPDRFTKPRQSGITMVMDKGLSVRQAEDFMESGAEYTDIIKLGWATSLVTPKLEEKLRQLDTEMSKPSFLENVNNDKFFLDYESVKSKLENEYKNWEEIALEVDLNKTGQ